MRESASIKGNIVMKFYHYTIADRLVKILISGYIKVMEESSKVMEDEVRLVWLTANPNWDNTAFYNYPSEVLDNAGRVRITLKSKYPSHKVFAQNIGMLQVLELSAKHSGVNIYDWGVSDKVIPLSDFECVELWKDEKWVEVPLMLNERNYYAEHQTV